MSDEEILKKAFAGGTMRFEPQTEDAFARLEAMLAAGECAPRFLLEQAFVRGVSFGRGDSGLVDWKAPLMSETRLRYGGPFRRDS